jgi:hypothetical protein
MADQGKGSGERLIQVAIVLITAIVGPIAVWFTTNTNSPLNASRANPPGLTTTLSANLSATVVPPNGTATPIANFTAIARTAVLAIPSGNLPAGVPVVVNDLALLISKDDVSLDGSLLRLQIHLTNQATTWQEVTFTANSISIRDNTGKTYAIANGEGKDTCKKSDFSIKKTIRIEPGKEVVLQPLNDKGVSAWCGKGQEFVLPFFTGPLAPGSQTLTITLDDLGPFKGFSIGVIL